MVARAVRLVQPEKTEKSNKIKGFRHFVFTGCSLVVVPSAARSSLRSAIGSPLTPVYLLSYGTPAAEVG